MSSSSGPDKRLWIGGLAVAGIGALAYALYANYKADTQKHSGQGGPRNADSSVSGRRKPKKLSSSSSNSSAVADPISPTNSSHAKKAQMLFSNRDYRGSLAAWTAAIHELERGGAADPVRLAKLYTNRANTHFHLRNHHSSLDDATTAIRLNGDSSLAHYAVARAAKQLRNYEMAIQAYQAALTVSNPNAPTAACKEGIQFCREKLAQIRANQMIGKNNNTKTATAAATDATATAAPASENTASNRGTEELVMSVSAASFAADETPSMPEQPVNINVDAATKQEAKAEAEKSQTETSEAAAAPEAPVEGSVETSPATESETPEKIEAPEESKSALDTVADSTAESALAAAVSEVAVSPLTTNEQKESVSDESSTNHHSPVSETSIGSMENASDANEINNSGILVEHPTEQSMLAETQSNVTDSAVLVDKDEVNAADTNNHTEEQIDEHEAEAEVAEQDNDDTAVEEQRAREVMVAEEHESPAVDPLSPSQFPDLATAQEIAKSLPKDEEALTPHTLKHIVETVQSAHHNESASQDEQAEEEEEQQDENAHTETSTTSNSGTGNKSWAQIAAAPAATENGVEHEDEQETASNPEEEDHVNAELAAEAESQE